MRPKVAIAHDYLTQRGGAERVVLSLARIFPEAPIYTTLYDPETTFPEFRDLDVRTSWLNTIGPLRRRHRMALPLLASASSSVKIDADVVLASSSGWAHGFGVTGAKLVYCYSPARWLYQTDAYLGQDPGAITRRALNVLSKPLQRWDRAAARSADRYLAISTVVQARIAETYGLPSEVVPAPLSPELGDAVPEPVVDPWFDQPDNASFLLCVSRLLPYKNVDAVVAAMALRPTLRLVIVGRGPEAERLQAMAPANVHMLGGLTDGQMNWLYERAVGLVAASYEDFGLTPLEAAFRGKPSAVLRAGGFLDTMVEGETAVFFDRPEAGAIAAAMDQLLAADWRRELLIARAGKFSESGFADALRSHVDELAEVQSSEVNGFETRTMGGFS